MRCDLNCPLDNNGPYRCCVNCNSSRGHLKAKYRDKWDDDNGFWSLNGCRLTRDEMPKECIEYDCKKYRIYIVKTWTGNSWNYNAIREIPNEKVDKNLIDKYNELLREYT